MNTHTTAHVGVDMSSGLYVAGFMKELRKHEAHLRQFGVPNIQFLKHEKGISGTAAERAIDEVRAALKPLRERMLTADITKADLFQTEDDRLKLHYWPYATKDLGVSFRRVTISLGGVVRLAR